MFVATLIRRENTKIDYGSQLQKYGYQVAEYAELNELVQDKSRHIDVLIIDLELSNEDWCNIPKSQVKCIQLIEPNSSSEQADIQNTNTVLCLTKPVDIKALIAVIEGVCRHVECETQVAEVEHRLCTAKRTLCLSGGDKISLSSSEGIILHTLAMIAPQPVSRKSLSESLGQDFRFYDERKLEAIVSRLRRKIKPLTPNAEVIKAARGRGYQLMLNIAIT
ncbi:winged helix-turn-helix domain-containing protein [Pseudoalteromonas sp. S16_S37]|uniref:winged helix-turn-helix domain-containing protein n=1 Tax=Pseudoalteromonas sp. S16_S37 TaxID=2720228 RepID=UPI001680DFD0|nr:winged helix-turn-helix domain-containing protein [Pseudoalteromonas sp. S16_S37]MBD1580882.1 response regulator transcription factor [Pseudoalteromonas sp. S16_S37]